MQKKSKSIIQLFLGAFALILMSISLISFAAGNPDPFSTNLALAFVFGNVVWEGGDNIGGFTSKAYLAIHHEVDTWPTQDRNAITDEEMVQLSGNYIMKNGKKFYEVYSTPRTLGGESENQGDIDGKSFLQKVAFFIPGTSKQNMAFARKLNNTQGILLVKDPNTGNMIQFGDEDFPLHFKPRLSSGNQPTDRRGLFVDCEADNFNAALLYPGTIPLSESEIPAS